MQTNKLHSVLLVHEKGPRLDIQSRAWGSFFLQTGSCKLIGQLRSLTAISQLFRKPSHLSKVRFINLWWNQKFPGCLIHLLI